MPVLRLALAGVFALLALAAHAQNATLTIANLGLGTVTDTSGIINCGTTCSGSFATGTSVTLTAAPATNWSFSAWQSEPPGLCAGAGATCTFTITQSTTVSPVFQGIATFTLKDRTNLTPNTYQIYVTGYSTAGPYVLNKDGSWIAPTAPSAGQTLAIPCWRFPQDITQVQINSTQTNISARVYYFVVTDTATFKQCNPTNANAGLFNVANAFTYTQSSLNLATPPVSLVTSKQFPAWTFSEIGTGPFNGTIDLSQVDFFAFPMNTGASVPAGNPAVVGNPVGAQANPADVVNHLSVRDSYVKYVNAQAAAQNSNKTCLEDDTPVVCAYLELEQSVRTTVDGVAQYVIQNPGGYLGQNTSVTQQSRLNHVFDGVIDALWHGSNPPTLTINTGGNLGGIPQDTFTSSIVAMPYPGTTFMVTAMKFTGTSLSGNYVAYVFSPRNYNTGCENGQIPSTYCTSPTSPGWQVFAGGGALNTPVSNDTYTYLLNGNLLSANASTYGAGGYNQIVGRLAFLISAAMNRGVALVNCSQTYTYQCWQDETYWYPTGTSTTYPDITQSVFSRWMHTAVIGGTPMFLQPPGAVQSASTAPGQGKTMGMAYGFADDENPTPQVTASAQPEVPSKLDSTVIFYGAGPYEITFGPWVTKGELTPTLAVLLQGKGSVSSSPGGIDCDPTCSHPYTRGAQVILTAKPAKGWVFVQWTGGGCTGSHSTTCNVTLSGSATTTVTAEFGEILAAPPAPPQEGMHVVVQGPGTVASTPTGIACGHTCSKAFAIGTVVTLAATPAAGSIFAGWSGACSGNAMTCTVTVSDANYVGAAFIASSQNTLRITSSAGGVVTSLPAGIDCGTRCAAGFAPGALVSLIAEPRPGYRFAGWSGACSGSQTCDLAMDGNRSVQATFAAIAPGQYPLTVHDFGLGSIVSSPPGINCGTACSAAFPIGTRVSLFASPAPGYQFAGWTGACTGSGACVVYMDDIASVDALFQPQPGVAPPAPTEPIPTLSEWALLLLVLMMLAVGYRHSRPAARSIAKAASATGAPMDRR